ncbi:MAG TPA: hypothetical protein VLU73_03460 [Methylococcaceae bacterium]|jgi:hypothetical protein|nr:hypothetical protein [Methylococcaceae bacterium]
MFLAYVSHSLPGRVRIKIPSRRSDAAYFVRLEAELARCKGVASIQVNLRAASVLIGYAPTGDLNTIATFARKKQLFDLAPEGMLPPQQSIGELVAGQIKFLDRLIETGTRGHMDLQSSFFLLFLVLGLRQMWRGDIMQPAIPLLWRAMEVLDKR